MTPHEHAHDHAHAPGDDHEAGAHFHPDSLNPALEGLRFCPRCGAAPRIDFPRSLRCEHCGYAARREGSRPARSRTCRFGSNDGRRLRFSVHSPEHSWTSTLDALESR